MALSPNATKALQQANSALCMLYGAGYFTEEEWINIDRLVHKGKYEFTSGPDSAAGKNASGDLLSFDDDDFSTEPSPTKSTSDEHDQVQATSQPDLFSFMEELNDSPITSQSASITTSAKTSSIAESTPISEPIDAFEPAKEIETDTPAPEAAKGQLTEPPKSDNTPPKHNTPPLIIATKLPQGCTQEQLDEARRFNASFAKRCDQPVAYKGKAQVLDTTTVRQKYPSPGPTEKEAGISDWATGVEGYVTHTNTAAAPEPEQRQFTISRAQERPSPAELVRLRDDFVRVHGRVPGNLNDIWQGKNTALKPSCERAESVISNTTAKARKTKPLKLGPIVSRLNVESGTILIAQRTVRAKSALHIDVTTGDKIEVQKIVSGITHKGRNLRTKQVGQFSEEIFIPVKETLKVLDHVEISNAATWETDHEADEAHSVKKQIFTVPKTPTITKIVNGLSSSRFSADPEPNPKPEPLAMTAAMKVEMSRMVDEKLKNIMLNTQQPTTSSFASSTLPTASNPLTVCTPWSNHPEPIKPKTTICYWWYTPGRICRYKDEECRDLHSLPTQDGDVKLSKPTSRGAIVDYLPPGKDISAAAEISEQEDPKGRKLTCWYWVNSNCNYGADACKFLHTHSGSTGVAQQPRKNPFPWKSWGSNEWRKNSGTGDGEENGEPNSWGPGNERSNLKADDGGWPDSRTELGDGGFAGDHGDLVLEQASDAGMDAEGNGGWAAASQWGGTEYNWGGNDTGIYKPPHVKVMEAAKVAALW